MIEVDMVLDAELRKTVFNLAGRSRPVRNFFRLYSGFFLILGIFYLYLALNKNIQGHGFTCAFMGVLFILVALFTRKVLFLLNERKWKKKTDNKYTVTYGFSEEGVTITDSLKTTISKWESYDSHGTEGHYLWIHSRTDRTYLMVDKNKLAEDQLAQLEKWFSALPTA